MPWRSGHTTIRKPSIYLNHLRMVATSMPATLKTGRNSSAAGLGIGALSVFYSGQGVNTLAIPYFQMTHGMDPFLLSLLLTVPVIFSSTLAPWFGFYSDRFNSRFGPRKPFLAFASILSALLYGLIWMVPLTWSDNSIALYLGTMILAFCLSTTAYNTAYTALLYEFSHSTVIRHKAIALKAYAFKVGSLLYYWVFPASQLAIFSSVSDGVKTIGWIASAVIFLACGLAPVFFTPAKLPQAHARTTTFVESFQQTLRNRTVRMILLILICQLGGAALAASMDYYLLVYYVCAGDIARGAVLKGILSTSYAIVGIIYVKILSHLSLRLGYGRTLSLVFIINIFGGIAKWWIFTPDMAYWIWVDSLLCSAVWSAIIMSLPAILSKVSLHDQFGTGLVGSVQGWVIQAGAIVAMLGMGITLNAIGFSAPLGGNQDPLTILTMRGILSGGTVFFSVICLSLLLQSRTHLQKYGLW